MPLLDLSHENQDGKGRPIKASCRELRNARDTGRKVVWSEATEFRHEGEVCLAMEAVMGAIENYLYGLIEAQEKQGNVRRRGIAPFDFRRIIHGETYNSATSASFTSASPPPDTPAYKWFLESLYQTCSGAWYLVGEGMEGTPWSFWMEESNDWCRGHMLLPLSEAEARRWMELRGLDQRYVDIFGEPDEAEGPDTMLLRLPPATKLRVAPAADAEGVSARAWVVRAVNTALDQAPAAEAGA
jgi:hypothetical protein